jgi:uncharacterized glyoxalase superfamily protein PhnB
MPDTKTAVTSDIIPFFRYNDGCAAIAWLQAAFGFDPVLVVDGKDGAIEHAQLRLGNALIMVSSPQPGEPKRSGPPDGSTGVYVIVDDADAHYERAKAAGAEILRAPQDEDYGGRDYTVRDLQGNVWSFGTYRPET